MDFFKKEKRTAFEAKEAAQWIAFGPVIFQSARVLRNTGILKVVEESLSEGITLPEIAEKVKLPVYGVRVLLESGLGAGLVLVNEGRYTLGKTGYFILHDPLTNVNMDFVHDVNYKGLFDLEESIVTGKPAGLKEFGEWQTIYEGLSQLPEHVQKSWFSFDHFFSDDAFPKVLSQVYKDGVKNILDIGGNTGKWAVKSVNHSSDISVTIMDLPGQLNVAKQKVADLGLENRISFIPANILDESVKIPKGFDAIWLSQFLDCFSEDQIVSILKRCKDALGENGELIILEPFWDRQKYEIAAFCLQQTSVYFTALANGNSQMYSAETFLACIRRAGLEITEQVDNIGLSQTLLKCKKEKITTQSTQMKKEKVDVLVIGAGPAGTVAASIINKAGYNVKIVEKVKFPRFVIGESLLPRCMEALTEAGFVEAVAEKKFQEKNGAKFVKNGVICDYSFADQFTEGWSWTWQVPRAEFDQVLADTVEKMGVPVSYETTVTGIVFNGSDSVTTVEDKDGNISEIEAKFIVDGSGYGRVIPRLFNLDKPSNLAPRKALFSHVVDVNRSMDEEPNRITIIVHKKGVWIWVIPFSNGNTSVGFVGDPEFFSQYTGTPEEQLRELLASQPYLAERMKGIEMVFEPRVLQSWSTTTEKFYGEGFVLTGNVTEFLDPVFSSGVTLATVSSQKAANLVIRKLKGENVDWHKEYTEPMMQGVNTFRSYVMAWYEGTLDTIFFAKKQNPEIKRMICSVLAGYVWDLENPYVKDHATALTKLARLIDIQKVLAENETEA
jgi:flavin-dependent dehydrogenase/ubiquinone/menaquinone biosynthesis C-methylase UbiE